MLLPQILPELASVAEYSKTTELTVEKAIGALLPVMNYTGHMFSLSPPLTHTHI